MYQVLFSSLERASSFVMYILKYLEIFVSLLRNNKTRDVNTYLFKICKRQNLKKYNLGIHISGNLGVEVFCKYGSLSMR